MFEAYNEACRQRDRQAWEATRRPQLESAYESRKRQEATAADADRRRNGASSALQDVALGLALQGANDEDLATQLDRKGVFARHGHHCTMPLHDHLGVSATTRVSFGMYNTTAEIDVLCEAIQFARKRFGLA